MKIQVPGRTYQNFIPEGEIQVDQGSPSCRGADVMHQGKLFLNVLELMSVEFTILEVELEAEISGRGNIWRRDTALLLPCTANTRECELTDGIMVWEVPAGGCPYAVVRSFSAVLAGGVVRGVKKDEIWLPLHKLIDVSQLPCPQIQVWSTNVDRLLVAARSAAVETTFPPLSAEEVDIQIQLTVQQMFLQERLEEMLNPQVTGEDVRCQLLWQLMTENKLLAAGQRGHFLFKRG